MRVKDRIQESASWLKNDSRTAEKYQHIKRAFDVLIADEVRRGKFHDTKQIEDVVEKSGAELEERSNVYDGTNPVDREILGEIAGEFMAGQRAHEERIVPEDLLGVGELFAREYREQNKKCEMTEATLGDVYEKCKQLLSSKVRPDLLGILDDIYLGTLAKLRIRSAGVLEDIQKLYEPIIDTGLPKKSAELRAVRIHDDISQTDVACAGCKDLIARLRERLDLPEIKGMVPSIREHLEELYMALDKKTAFTEYYRNKAQERLVRGDPSSASQLADTFREMTRSLQDDAQQLSLLLDRYAGNRADRGQKLVTNEELSERAYSLLQSAKMRADDLLNKLTQRQDELSALKAIDNPDDERRRTAYLIEVLTKGGGHNPYGIVGESFARAQDNARRVAEVFHELRGKNLVTHKKLEADYEDAVRAYSTSAQEASDTVDRLNDTYLSLFPEALQP